MGVRYEADTFLFTEVKRSAELWEKDPEGTLEALRKHDSLIEAAVIGGGGEVVRPRGEGESLFAVFPDASGAIQAAVEIQRRLKSEQWGSEHGIELGMGINSGYAEKRDGDFYGTAVNRAARLRSLAHSGQVLVGGASESLARDMLPPGTVLKDLGLHRLKDLARPEHVFQVVHEDLDRDFPPLRSLDALPNNLPIQLTSFIGRHRELEEVRRLITSARLITLTGTGGTGKTRLALQLAAELLDEFKEGVWVIDLAAVSDPASVSQAFASQLRIREQSTTPEAALIEELSGKKMLLIPDNCEHVVAACAQLVEDLLSSCPELTVLATSREALGARGEVIYRIPTFEVPDPERPPPLDEITRFASIDLFVTRAKAAEPAFSLTESNAPWIAQLCKRLDGIPLAIELAAARVRVLSPQQIAGRLDDRFQFLTGGARTALDRQKTLKALVDWSFNLLSEREKKLLRRLSVFLGGFTLEAAESVCSSSELPASDLLDLLSQLVDKSLVHAELEGPSNRYRQLETIRQYGAERLAEAGESQDFYARHREWFVSLAEKAEAGIVGPEPAIWLHRVDAERDNLRAVFDRVKNQPEFALRLSAALWEYYEVRGDMREGRRFLEDALARSPAADPEVRAKALRGLGNLAMDQGDFEAATAALLECLEIETRLANKEGMGKALNNLGVAAHEQGDLDMARRRYEESLVIMRELGDERGIAILLNNIGSIAHRKGDHEEALRLHEESLGIRRKLGNPRYIAHSLNNLGNVASALDETDKAISYYNESLQLRQELGDRGGISLILLNLGGSLIDKGEIQAARRALSQSLEIRKEIGDRKGIVDTLESLALVLKKEGELEKSVIVYGCSNGLRESIGTPLEDSKVKNYAKSIAELRGQMGDDAFEKSWEKGQTMDIAEASDIALGNAIS